MEETMRTLDNLVNAGKVRYIGVSHAPAWKIAQAQTMAWFKDWTPFAGLQIEYSLLQRTIEDELIPMALELGIGVTPWGPLKGGLLSGKYNRANNGQVIGSRMEARGAGVSLTEKQLSIIDELERIAQMHNTTPAAIALSWVTYKPGVSSTIIGVKNVKQLESNLNAVNIKLSTNEIGALDALSTPPPTFVTEYKELARTMQHGGIEINGIKPPVAGIMSEMQVGKY